MSTPSSIIRSAQSARKKRRAYEDAVAAFEYDLSPKGQDDFERYVAHINQRIETTADPSEILSYQKKVYSAQTTYFSHEIQRQSIDVLEGNATLTDKHNTIYYLHQQALATGDLDLAQGLRLQLDSLDLQLQAQEASYASLAKEMAENDVADLNSLVTKINEDPNIDGFAKLSQELRTKGEKGVEDYIQKWANKYKGQPDANGNPIDPKNVGMWDFMIAQARRVEGIYAEAARIAYEAGDYKEAKTYEDKALSITNGTYEFNVAGKKYNFPTIIKNASLSATGNDAAIIEATTETDVDGNVVYGITDAVRVGYAWGKNPITDQYELIEQTANPINKDDFSAPLLDENGQEIKVNGKTVNAYDLLHMAGYNTGDIVNGELEVQRSTNTRIRGEREGIVYNLAGINSEKLRTVPGYDNGKFYVVMNGNTPVFRAPDSSTAYEINPKTGVISEIDKPLQNNPIPGPDSITSKIASTLMSAAQRREARNLTFMQELSGTATNQLDAYREAVNRTAQADRERKQRISEQQAFEQRRAQLPGVFQPLVQGPTPAPTSSAPAATKPRPRTESFTSDLAKSATQKKKDTGFTGNLANTLLGR